MKETSQTAYQDILPLLKIDPSQSLFATPLSEVWLEIGFGGGEHMLAQLAQNPAISMIGCEPFINGVAKLLSHLSLEDYHRVRLWHEDVRVLLERVSPSYFTRAFILFPDPWPKKRHHRRRLITNEFVAQLGVTLKENALLFIASDEPSYVEQIQEVCFRSSHFTLRKGPSSPDPVTWTLRPEGWPATRYEQKALAQGKQCAYMVFQKKENVS